ncbi:MAG: cyclase family protein [Caldilineaceae bacterium]|nr:cyclase family protein [Caldilineaceae bacterium]
MQQTAQLLAALTDALQSGQVRVVDLTQPLSPETPVINLPPIFGQSPPLTIECICQYDDTGPAWYWNTLHLGEHTGTHFDAPAHWITGRELANNTTDALPVERFIGPACVIDASREAAADPDFLVTRAYIQAWEAQHGAIPAGAWLLLRTDWSKRTGSDFLNDSHTPGFDADALRYLAHERDVKGVGVETVGTDAGQAGGFDPPFPAHNIMHGAGKYGLASLANLDQLPPQGAVVVAAPLKIVQGSGSPVRVFALVGA